MSAFYCAGNWKLNKTPTQALDFAGQLLQMAEAHEQKQMIIFPPALVAFELARAFKTSGIQWGLQNCYSEASGAFTGENSAAVAWEMGAQYSLVGHSERRHVFAEPEDMIAKKVTMVQSAGLIPILCVGETLDDRRWNRTQEVIQRQIRQGLSSADTEKPIWIAYEPVWAIGTGEVASPSQVDEAHSIIRKILKEWSANVHASIPILYGGSVKSDHVSSLAGIHNVNGFLIGGASLDPKEFLKILRASNEIRK